MGWENNNTFQVVIIDGPHAGLFVYNGAPALGNLVYTIALNSGTDDYGNAYLPGATSYQQITGTDFQAGQVENASFNFWSTSPAGAGGPWNLLWQMALQPDEVGVIMSSLVNGHSIVVGETAAALEVSGGAEVLSGGESIVGGLTTDTALVSTTAAAGHILDVVNAASPSSPNVRLTVSAVGDPGYGMRIAGDANSRVLIDTNPNAGAGLGGGRFRAGPGTGALDASLYRFTGGNWAADAIAFNNSGVPEVWNAVTFVNSWANNPTGPNMQYRHVAAPYNSVQIIGKIVIPVGFAVGQAIISPLPAAYRPANAQSLNCWDITLNAPVRLQLGTAGGITWQGSGVAGPVAGDIVEILPSLPSLDA